MAQTYLQLQKQIETLQRRADELREKELDGVIDRIKVAITHYGLTAEQLGLGGARATRRKAVVTVRRGRKSSVPSAKYADGNGGTWVGRGPRPMWLRNALAEGKKLEDFLIGKAA